MQGSNPATETDIHFMRLALEQAQLASDCGEVPVGAVVVAGGLPLVRIHNQTYAHCDPAGHAEVLALRRAAELQQSPRLVGCTLYVTLEPCCMCVGAMVHARIERLVYGADEPRTGAIHSAFKLADAPQHNHHFSVTGGVLAEQSAVLMKGFFEARRSSGAIQPDSTVRSSSEG